jgi:hypothetical protein
LSDWGSKPYKAKDCGFSFGSVRMIDFLVQFFWGGGAVSVAHPAAKSRFSHGMPEPPPFGLACHEQLRTRTCIMHQKSPAISMA